MLPQTDLSPAHIFLLLEINPLKLGFHITAFINMKLDQFIGHLQKFGKTQTQIVFSTPVEPRSLNLEHMDDPQLGSELS